MRSHRGRDGFEFAYIRAPAVNWIGRTSADKQPDAAPTSDDAPQTLPPPIRGELESPTGRALAHIRMHAGEQRTPSPRPLRAVASGSDIHVAAGQLAAKRPEYPKVEAHAAMRGGDRNTTYFPVPRIIGCALACGLCVSLVSLAHADPPSVDVEKADRLFAEARALLASNLLRACEKFDESLRYNPAAIGTLLNVALCDEKLGRVASAVAKFSEARDRAREQDLPEHLRAAEDHIAALAPSVPHLTVRLTESLPSIQIVIDDHVVAPDDLDGIAVDPGERTLTVTAPSRLPFRSKLTIHRSEHRAVVVPPLETSLVVQSSRRRIGQISTAVGSVAIATGIGIGLYARSVYLAQFGHRVPGDGLCNSMNICEAAGHAGTERARTLGNVGTIVGVVGIAVAGIGAYLWFRSPGASDSSDKRLTFALDAGPAWLTAAAMGKF